MALHYSFIHHHPLNADNIYAAIAWLKALDELEVLRTVELLQKLLNIIITHDNRHCATLIRVRLCHARTSQKLRSNVTLSALVPLEIYSSHKPLQADAMAAFKVYFAAFILFFDIFQALISAVETSWTETLDLLHLDGDTLLYQEAFLSS